MWKLSNVKVSISCQLCGRYTNGVRCVNKGQERSVNFVISNLKAYYYLVYFSLKNTNTAQGNTFSEY